MLPMRLLMSPTSPYVRKVRVVALELGMELHLENVNPWSSDSPVGAANPLGKIPALILPSNDILYDSAVIVDYLIAKAGNTSLLGKDLEARFRIKTQEALADGILDAAVSVVLERRREPAQQSATAMQRAVDAIHRSLAAFANALPPTEPLQLNSIALGVAIGYVEFPLPELSILTAHPALARFYQPLRHRACFECTEPPT